MTTTLYSMHTVAARLEVTERSLRDWLYKHPWDKFGQPYYSAMWGGNKRRFTENDIARIKLGWRSPARAKCITPFAVP